jgi:hypothetical protein
VISEGQGHRLRAAHVIVNGEVARSSRTVARAAARPVWATSGTKRSRCTRAPVDGEWSLKAPNALPPLNALNRLAGPQLRKTPRASRFGLATLRVSCERSECRRRNPADAAPLVYRQRGREGRELVDEGIRKKLRVFVQGGGCSGFQ